MVDWSKKLKKIEEMVDWSKNLTTCQSVSPGTPNLELAAQSRQLQPFFQLQGVQLAPLSYFVPKDSQK